MRNPRPKKNPPTESAEQIEYFKWVDENINPKFRKLIWHVPNGGHRHIFTAMKLKREGVRAGVPDIFIATAKSVYHGAFIELKRISGSKVYTEQQEYFEALTEQGYFCKICRGAQEAIEVTKYYLSLK